MARRGFVFNLSPCGRPGSYFKRKVPGYPEDVRIMKRILSRLEAPAAVFGWAEPEWTFTTLLNRHDHYLMCGRAANLSFHAAIKPRRRPPYRQTSPGRRRKLDQKCYIAFMTSEGDTPRVSSSFFMGGWYDRYRGELPMNWGMNPLEAQLMPAHVEYYYTAATRQDCFYAGVGGAGYVFFNKLRHHEPFVRHAADPLTRAGMDVIELWHNGRIDFDRYRDYVKACGLRGIVHLPISGVQVKMLTESTPLVSMHKGLVHYYGMPEQSAERIRSIASRGLPAFVPVYRSPRPDVVTQCQRICRQLDPNVFEPVRLDVLMDLAAQAGER